MFCIMMQMAHRSDVQQNMHLGEQDHVHFQAQALPKPFGVQSERAYVNTNCSQETLFAQPSLYNCLHYTLYNSTV